jgi:hypothetical protein
MIIFKGSRTENKTTSFLDFTNESKKVVSIPVPTPIADLILAHLRFLSSISEDPVEWGNEEQSD